MSMLKNNVQSENEIKTRPWTDKDKELLIELYPVHSNSELCIILCKTEGQLRGMKERLGLNQKYKKRISEYDIERIKKYYEDHCDSLDLDLFSQEIGLSKSTISRYAKKFNLTKKNRPLSDNSVEKLKRGLSKYMQTDKYINIIKPKQIELLNYYVKNEHPKGMLGKHHSEETCKKLSVSHIEMFANMSFDEKHRRAMKAVNTKRKNGGFSTTSNSYSRCKGGIRSDLNKYFRSAWEANVARSLNYLHIKWEYEYKRFDFSEEKEGILSYQPDFYLPKYNKWIEVKGWMDDKSKQRLKLFKKYYPNESSNLILIDENIYNSLNKQYSEIIDNWE